MKNKVSHSWARSVSKDGSSFLIVNKKCPVIFQKPDPNKKEGVRFYRNSRISNSLHTICLFFFKWSKMDRILYFLDSSSEVILKVVLSTERISNSIKMCIMVVWNKAVDENLGWMHYIKGRCSLIKRSNLMQIMQWHACMYGGGLRDVRLLNYRFDYSAPDLVGRKLLFTIENWRKWAEKWKTLQLQSCNGTL